ncbi:hypothetical protein EB796_017075 [Bugula neritina]|uniref:XDH n=1 Tax=Bugula neritina TaxID=10212 RepID=A0A7J7JG94_BUGNE|nr:hypothetical protein EB796_017075 [Bugula neritina]
MQVKIKSTDYAAGHTLGDYIRDKALLKGTKLMCREGGCGVCTVTITDDSGATFPVNSCLVPLHKCNGWNVTTIEGLGSSQSGYHKIQADLADKNGSQCGYCSPGMVMTMFGALQQDKEYAKSKLESSFYGNICRCTGYRPIMKPCMTAVKILRTLHLVLEYLDIASCASKGSCSAIKPTSSWATADGPQWLNPQSIDELRQLIQQHAADKYMVVAGNTGGGVYKNDGPYDVFVDVKNVQGFNAVTLSDDKAKLIAGAGVTLTQLLNSFQDTSKANTGFQYLSEAASYLDKVANLQIRNMGSWAGNLMMKHKHRDFISDVFTLLECVGATLNVYDCEKKSAQQVTCSEFLQVGSVGLIIESVELSARSGWSLYTYKTMPRYRNAYSMLSLAVFMQLDDTGKVVSAPSVVYAGVTDDFVHASELEAALVGKTLSQDSTVQECMTILDKIKCDENVGQSSADYRNSLVKSLFYKAVLSLVKSACEASVQSGGETLTRYPVSQPIPKLDSRKQTAGEAQFIGDIPDHAGQLFAAFVKSTIAAGEIQSIDTSKALSEPGVVRVLTFEDIPGKNVSIKEEPFLIETTVEYYGQPLAIILAETEQIALSARELVTVTYTNVKTPILSTEQAVKAKSFFKRPPDFGGDLVVGDAQAALVNSDVVFSGVVETGEQYPMHMETQVTLAVPQEGHYLLLSATQVMAVMQTQVAALLALETNEVEVKVRRAGGGFGAKQSRSVYVGAGAALGAYCTQRPVKMCLTLEDNMEILGRRQPFRMEYTAGINKDMKIQAIVGSIYEDCGFYDTDAMTDVVVHWLDNVYLIPNWDVKAFKCKTNQPNHTYIRTPGIVSAMHIIEQIVGSLAAKLGVSHEQLREANFYKDGDKTPFNQVVSPCYITDMWNQMKKSVSFDDRSEEISAFNASNKWTKKAITLTPVRYGCAFWPGTSYLTHVFVNYSDASVAIAHGGVELGQGINTKVVQVAAQALGVSMDNIKIHPTSTSYNANSSTTGGSITSDMNCVAVKKACDILVARMAPFKKDGKEWKDIVTDCAKAQVDLHAKYFVVNSEMSPATGGFFNFDVFGAACTEAELDVLTGNYIIRQMNVLYDCGTSISPEIDVGQIEGAVVMGIGLLLHEEVKYDMTTGRMLTNNTWKYHVPMNSDIPENFQVDLLRGHPNKAVHYGNKITAEPPFLLAESAVESISRCVYEFRRENGNTDVFIADAPFTVEKIHLACAVDAKKFIVQ